MVSNHESFVDILLISHLPWEMKWLSKKELFRLPVMGWLMRLAGDIPLKRGFGPSTIEAMAKCREALANRVSVMIFPEGTRSATAEMLPFKDGAFRLAIDAGVPILPLAVARHQHCPAETRLALRPLGRRSQGARAGGDRRAPAGRRPRPQGKSAGDDRPSARRVGSDARPLGPAQIGWCSNSPDRTAQGQQGQPIRQHQEQLIRDVKSPRLENELHCGGGAEEERSDPDTDRMPPSEHDDRDRDVPPPRRHLLGKRSHLREHQGCAGQTGESSSHDRSTGADEPGAHACRPRERCRLARSPERET